MKRTLAPAARLAILFLLPLAAFPCLASAQQKEKQSQEYKIDADVPYRSGDDLPESMQRCRLDVYYPIDRKDFATVVWFHGGGLTAGNKSIPQGLKNRGIAVVAVNYRLGPAVKSPAYIEDAAAAVAWTFNHIADYGGSRDRIYVSGHSAGGYLTSMVGLDRRWLAAHDIDANEIAGLIPFSGHTITHFTIRKERGIGGKQPVVDDLAPLYHVRKDAPPLLLITGDRELEMLGRYEENAYLWRMMQVVGHPNTELLELDGYDHGGMDDPAYPLMLKFIRKDLASKR
ncbi:alpha/beta hydrolase [Rosistilla oblonga]|uniref:alpha/beta hydrolase n=1 Tax=Rosistilla oblonga TaxID=2527990 RepID=UPI003A976FA3